MKTWQALVLGIFVGLIAGGAIYLIASPRNHSQIEFISPTPVTEIVISVTGNVAHPGLYTLPVGSRVNDALLAAGGILANTDLNGINLAKILEDGEQITVSANNTEPILSTNTTQGKININQATIEELDLLPGIGTEKAQAIIDFREKNGNFVSIEDIMAVPGFGPSIFDSIKELIDVK